MYYVNLKAHVIRGNASEVLQSWWRYLDPNTQRRCLPLSQLFGKEARLQAQGNFGNNLRSPFFANCSFSFLFLDGPSTMHLNAFSTNMLTNWIAVCSQCGHHVSYKRRSLLWCCEERAGSTIYPIAVTLVWHSVFQVSRL